MNWWATLNARASRIATRLGWRPAIAVKEAAPDRPRIFTRDAVIARRPDLTVAPRVRTEPPEYYLAIAVIAKDEGSYIEEWLDFHFSVGAEHIYFFDHFSTDDTREKLAPYIAAGKVTYHSWNQSQVHCYHWVITEYGHKARWIAFIDVDEFMFPATADTLKDVLVELENCPVVLLSWLQFGFGGHKKRPAGWVTRNFTRRAAVPSSPEVVGLLGGLQMAKCKSIVDPYSVAEVETHVFKPANNLKCYDSSGNETTEEMMEPSPSDKILLNHYYTRSEEEFAEKLAKWRALSPFLDSANQAKNEKEIARKVLRARAMEMDSVEDTRIARLLPRAMQTT